MRRFLLSLIFVGALSAVFSFTAFANWTDSVSSAYMGSGQATYTHTVTYNVSASPGDVWYFDVAITWYGETINNPSNQNITGQVYNRNFDKSSSLVALGSNYGAADVSTEGNRVWLVFNQSVSSVTVTLQLNYSFSWQSGTFNGSPVQDLSDCIAVTTVNANCGNINRSASSLPSLSSNSSKLDQILSLLGDPTTNTNFLGTGDDVIFYGRSDYFSGVNGASFNSEGWPVVSNPSDIAFINFSTAGMYKPGYTLTPGTYLFYIFYPQTMVFKSLAFEGVNPDFYEYKVIHTSAMLTYEYYAAVVQVNVSNVMPYTILHVSLNASSLPSVPIYCGMIRADSDYLAGESINPDQDSTVSDVDDAGSQQSQQEEEMWQNINTYKGDISFNLDGWDDAAGGLSYVTGVFMTIWNNSPTQPIVLSLMLGIAMLSIGRGVMAAVRVSRNRGDD